jgi:hypothetical protein
MNFVKVYLFSIGVAGLFLGTTAPSTDAQSLQSAEVIKFTGTVRLANGDKIKIGQKIGVSDRFQISKGSSVHLRCLKDSTSRWMTQDNSKNACPSTKKKSGPRGAQTRWDDERIPYLLSPRSTNIFNPRPVIQWQPALGATRYTVTISSSSQVIWTTEVTGTEVTYDGSSTLQPDEEYTVHIKANTGFSSQQEQGKFKVAPRFKLLSLEDQQQLNQKLAQVKSTGSYVDLLATADVYEDYDLYSEAILLLIPQATASPEIAQRLGDLYQQIKLDHLAVKSYQQALFQTRGDDRGNQALLYEQLGKSYVLLQQHQNAVDAYAQAQKYYELLGDQEMVEKMQQHRQEQQYIESQSLNKAK